MPEWPEMESYRNQLAGKIAGARILEAEVTREKSVNLPPQEFKSETEGRTIWFVEHRGKYLLFHLDNGKRLLLHLMLGGWIYYGEGDDAPTGTAQVVLRLQNGSLYFCGLRLGYLHLLTVKEVTARLAELGPEPFDPRLTPERFRSRYAGKRGKLKSALIDQAAVAGMGGCYSDEIAFAAGVRPTAAMSALSGETWTKLYASMQAVLRRAVEYGGYMEKPLYQGDALTGGYNDRCMVYDRGGEPCLQCGTPIVQTEVSSRKAFYCPECQGEA